MSISVGLRKGIRHGIRQGISPSFSESVAFFASNLNAGIDYLENGPAVVLPAIVVGHGNASASFTVTRTMNDVSAGTLSVSNGATFNSGVWAVSGTLTQINAALASITFAQAADYDQDFTITTVITSDDPEAPGPLNGTTSVNLEVPVNTAPQVTNLDATVNYTEDQPVTLPQPVVTDPDGDTITATADVSDPLAGVFNEPAGASYNSGTGILTISGTESEVNAAYAALGFTLSSNYNSAFTIDWIVSDGTDSDTGTWEFNGTAVNDPPEATNTTATVSYNQGDASADLPVMVVSDVDGDTVTVDAVLQDPTFGEIITPGASTYNSGTGEWQVSGSVSAVNAVLAALASGGFVPDPGTDTNTSIVVTVSDGTVSLPNGTITLDVIATNPELATNGTNPNDLTNWYAPRGQSTLSIVGSRVRASFTSTAAAGIGYQVDGLAVGEDHTAIFSVFEGTATTSNLYIRVDDVATLSVPSAPYTSDAIGITFNFTATESTMYFGVIVVNISNGTYVEMADLSVKLTNPLPS